MPKEPDDLTPKGDHEIIERLALASSVEGAGMNKLPKPLTREEKSLLLFFESCAVDQRGKVNVLHMNDADFQIAHRWDKEGFVRFGRICFRDIERLGTQEKSSCWVTLTPQAWKLAHAERIARAVRGWDARPWLTTEEARND